VNAIVVERTALRLAIWAMVDYLIFVVERYQKWAWIVAQGIGTALVERGKPWQNGVTESFNGKFLDECLSLEWFRSRTEAKVIIEAWRHIFRSGETAYVWQLSAVNHNHRYAGGSVKTN
jgi:hypothetical protein